MTTLTLDSCWNLGQTTFTAVVDKFVEHSFTFSVDTEPVNLNTTEGDAEVIPEVQEAEAEPSLQSRELNLVAMMNEMKQ